MANVARHAAQLGDLPTWNLADLYAGLDAPRVATDMAAAEKAGAEIAERGKGRLSKLASDDPDALAGLIRDLEKLDDLLGRLGSFAELTYAADSANPAHAKFLGDVQGKLTDIGRSVIFFTLELNRIDDAVLDRAFARSASLAHYRPWIEDVRKEKPHQLDDKLEELFLEKAMTGRNAWNRLFDETMTTLRFRIGRESLGLEATLDRLQDRNERVRRQAADALAATFRENLRLFTLVTNTLAKDKDIADRWRGFGDVAASRHLANRVEPEVVDALVSAVRTAQPRLTHRYYALKARWLGKDSLDHWDRNAPLPQVRQTVHSWDAARAMVIGAYREFSPKLAEIADGFFTRRWIDAGVREGKSPGAFSHPTVPSAHPCILMNYLGKPRDVMTLAHELGHGVHQVLAAPQGALMAPTPLTLAETASVFGEMLTFRRILATTTQPAQRKALLASKVEDMLNTVVRQIAFYSFEREVHIARKAGELTADDLCALWLKVQGESLGPSVRLGPGYETFWCYIPHFIHSPFYVYAYAFGDCLVNSLYAVYEKGDPRFAEKYFALLSAGGSKPYRDLLAPFGLDARDPGFWQMGLSLLDRMITELEGMG